MKCSDAGLAFIKQHEGYRSKAYRDSVGVLTIGVGHTGADVYENMEVSEAEALHFLSIDVEKAEQCIEDHVHQPLTQNQFDALCSFIFNLGCHAFINSTLLNLINAGNMDAAAAQFKRWTKAGGVELAGLVTRRTDESELFLT